MFKYDWLICWLDTETRKLHFIVNDKEKFEKFYEYYKDRIWVGYNSRNYDQWIAKTILCDFNPWDMNNWIINKERKGYEFSTLLNRFPIMNYDCSVGFRGLKELEAFMGHDIRESQVAWNIDRPLTRAEIESTLKYCKHDVMETFEVFMGTIKEYQSHIGLIKEFELPLHNISKTKAQLSAIILGASKVKRNDEFDIRLPETLQMGKYQWIADWYLDWSKNKRNYDEMRLETKINGVPHVLGIGGLHGAIEKYYGTGIYIMADVESYYPALMIEYDYLSRNVVNPSKFRIIRDERIVMKAKKDPRQQPRKIVLNGTFGASKDKYNNLYDPLQANNTCIAGQLLLIDLLDKLEGYCELIQSNTDGILVKVNSEDEKEKVIEICKEWMKRTRLNMEFDIYNKVIQRDVNNYIIVPEGDLYDSKGNERFKRKGAVVKKLNTLDNDLPIVNKAVVDYFVKGVPVEQTIMESDNLIDFQKVTKISGKYEYGFKEDALGKWHEFKVPRQNDGGGVEYDIRRYKGIIMYEKVHRCFASLNPNDGMLFKKHRNKESLDKTPSTPEKCFIDNSDITEKKCPPYLDKQWYVDLAKDRIRKFI